MGRVAAILVALAALFSLAETASAQSATCRKAYDSCIDRADRSKDSCEARCSSDSCYSRCDRSYDSRVGVCEDERSACTSDARAGGKATGDNGCYFGRCPGDEDKPTSSSRRTSSRSSSRDDDAPATRTARPQPVQPQMPALASVCYATSGPCPMAVALPQGSSCVCYTAYGQFPGVAR